MSKSNIEWTQDTWNPIVGCSILSPGCINCYAMPMAARIEAMNAEARETEQRTGKKHTIAAQYDGTTKKVNGNAVWTGKLTLAENVLLAPLKRKKPTTYFVNSMGDLFHEDCPDEWIDKVFAVMALCPQHTFQVLTKRAKRMRDYMWSLSAPLGRQSEMRILIDQFEPDAQKNVEARLRVSGTPQSGWQPLPNVWAGVSTERQSEYDERKVHLVNTMAAVRFFSMEPLIGPIVANYLADWVIVGGESGPAARPMHPDWARSLRDQCAAAGVPFFFKQWGEYRPSVEFPDANDDDISREGWRSLTADQSLTRVDGPGAAVAFMRRSGKKAAGRALDGMIHDEYPEAR